MEGGGTKGNTFVGTGCIGRKASTGHWDPLLRLANRNHQKAKVNKQIFFLLFEQNQITSHEKVKEREGIRFIRNPIKRGETKIAY